MFFLSFFFTDTPPPEIYTLSLHDALPIFTNEQAVSIDMSYYEIRSTAGSLETATWTSLDDGEGGSSQARSEEHTSELQSHVNLVCRLLLEKKKKKHK